MWIICNVCTSLTAQVAFFTPFFEPTWTFSAACFNQVNSPQWHTLMPMPLLVTKLRGHLFFFFSFSSAPVRRDAALQREPAGCSGGDWLRGGDQTRTSVHHDAQLRHKAPWSGREGLALEGGESHPSTALSLSFFIYFFFYLRMYCLRWLTR